MRFSANLSNSYENGPYLLDTTAKWMKELGYA
jgi:hypothetical protein